MIGLIIWASTDCRSLMGIFREIKQHLSCPVIIVVNDVPNADGLRQKTGFQHDEFNDISVIYINNDASKANEILESHEGYFHLFTVYQKAPLFRKLILKASKRGGRIGIISEAPCVMSSGIKGFIKKHFYLPFVVKLLIKDIVSISDFIINLSGDDAVSLLRIGWPSSKIIPWGYFSPPLLGSKCCKRVRTKDFHILVTGIMSWHRSPEVAMKALVLLKKWGINFRATFTQEGAKLKCLKKLADKYKLPVEFTGLLPIHELISLYETCSLYVASGRSEPWGMRLNDALQCGSPIAVCRGMGGVQMVDSFGCGFTFRVDDYVDLANKLRRTILENSYYLEIAQNAFDAASKISPRNKAKELIREVNARWSDWF